jgi:hypothetical protein
MSKRLAPGRREVSFDQFAEEHAEEMAAFDEFLGWTSHVQLKVMPLAAAMRRSGPPLPGWASEFKRSPFITLLSAAGRENCPDAFNHLLYFCLRRIGVKIPARVFVESPGVRGRPHTTAGVYETWIGLGKPPLGGTKLASAIFGEAFKKADRLERTRMIDRCRKTVARNQRRYGQNQAT